jgi:hypothetical protein
MPTCRYCGITKSNSSAIKKHIQLASSCRENYLADLSNTRSFAVDATSKISTSEYGAPLEETEQTTQLPTAFRGATPEDSLSDSDGPAAWSSPAEWLRFAEAYPGAAGMPVSSVKEKTRFESIHDAEGDSGPWGKHFKAEEEWELAKWLLHNAGQNQIDRFLKLSTVRSISVRDVDKIALIQLTEG